MKDVAMGLIAALVFILCTPLGWIGLLYLGFVIMAFQ